MDDLNFGELSPKEWKLIAQKAKQILKEGWMLPHLDECHLLLVQTCTSERRYLNLIDSLEVDFTKQGTEDFYEVLDNVTDAALFGLDYVIVGR
jgi:hypothetical protein